MLQNIRKCTVEAGAKQISDQTLDVALYELKKIGSCLWCDRRT